jgi:hypothetical protein
VTEPGTSSATRERFGCQRCWPDSAEAAWEARAGLRRGARLVDETHFIVRILSCRDCSQHFVSVFEEHVDWVDGDDPQYWTLMPVTEAEVSSLTAAREPTNGVAAGAELVPRLLALAPERRSLRRDYPKGEEPRLSWGRGIAIAS